MFKTVVAVIIMVVASIAGMFLGALFNNAIGGMILLALISVSPVLSIVWTTETLDFLC